MRPEGATKTRKEIAQADDQSTGAKTPTVEYRERFATPYVPAKRGRVHDFLESQEMRPKLRALEVTSKKRELTHPEEHYNKPL